MNLLDRIKSQSKAAPEQKGSISEALKASGSPFKFHKKTEPADAVVVPASAVPLATQIEALVPKTARPDLISETMRIVTLPLVDYFGCDLTDKYKRHVSSLPFHDASGSLIESLRDVQSAILAAIEACQGGLFPVGVGHGKAGAAILAPTALNAEVAVILTTSGTLTQLRKTFAVWRQHFKVLDNTHILSYDQLSTQTGTTLLEEIVKGYPDEKIVIVADEAHKLKRPDSARTKRLLRFFDGDLKNGLRGHPKARFVALSGTMTSKSLRDFSHLSRLALRHLSPVPHDEHDLDAWSECVDVEGTPGDLHWKRVEPLWRAFAASGKPMFDMTYEDRRSYIRKAFQARLRSCPGVVATDEQSIQCSLVVMAHDLSVPERVKTAMTAAQTGGLDPEGEPLPDEASVARIQRQLSAGFYYVWDWPNGEVDMDWMQARRRWHALVRIELQAHATQGYDSEFLVASKVARDVERGFRDEIHCAWMRWDKQRQKRWMWPDGVERPTPATRTIWVSTYFVEAALRFIKTFKEPVLIWYESRAIQEALRANGVEVRGAGEDPPRQALTVALSTRAHGEGLNLQSWTRNIILEPMSSGERWEQVLGRTHRPGQLADEIEVHVFQHTFSFQRSMNQAREDARYIEDTSGNRQKLNYATFAHF